MQSRWREGMAMNDAPALMRAITLFGMLLAGCCSVPTCSWTGCQPVPRDRDLMDAGTDAFFRDAPVRDTLSRDVGFDAHIHQDVYGADAIEWDAFVPDAYAHPLFPRTTEDPRPCEPPMAATPRPRELPADATPRVLWSVTQAELGLTGRIANAGAVDGLGDLHFSDVDAQHRGAVLSASGLRLGRGDGNTGAGPYGPLMVSMDGRTVEWSTDLIRIDRMPPAAEFGFVRPRVELPEPNLAATHGGFYAFANGSSTLLHYCLEAEGARLQWSMRGLSMGRNDVAFVLADDSIWMRGSPASDQRAFHIRVDGDLIEFARSPTSAAATTIEFVGDLSIIRPALSPDLITMDGFGVLARTPVAGPYRIDPSGSIWTRDTGGMRWTRFDRGVAAAQTPADRIVDLGSTYAFPIGEDGSFLLHGGTPAAPTLFRMGPDGSIAWELPVPGEFTYVTHDLDGRVYLYGDGLIMAVQTDVLPPAVRGCWQHRCSAAGDLRIE